MTTRFISESEALRMANLPATPKWRSFLRARLGGEQVAGGVVYDRFEAEILARKIGPFAKDVFPKDQPAPTRSGNPRLVDRNGPCVSL
jgi:hypothetical protein